MRVYPGRRPIGLDAGWDLEMPRMEMEALGEQNFTFNTFPTLCSPRGSGNFISRLISSGP
jgi:hypothetical protein